MKRSIKLAVAAAVALTSTSAFATNGDNLIATGAKALGMGGAASAHYNGAESATANPALITKGKGTQFTFGGTYFTPDVKVKTTAGSNTNMSAGTDATSGAEHNVIPHVAMTTELGDGWAVGLSMYGSAGMGTDWRQGSGAVGTAGTGTPGLYSMRSNLMLMKFSAPIAYQATNELSVGIAPVVMYGSLDIAFIGNTDANTSTNESVGRGSSSDIGLGYEVGATYTMKDIGLTTALRYQSPIMMEYLNQISVAAAAFGYGSTGANFAAKSDKLEQPAEYGVGLDWTQGDLSVAVDWKNIQWANAAGYGDFGWENQNVYAIGLEYRMDKLALRAGYNYAKNPIKNNMNNTRVHPSNQNTNGDTMNTFNHILFPAVTEQHYTVGLGYEFSKNVGADFAFMYATSPDVTVSGATVGLGNITVTNDQMAVAANLNMKF